MSETNKTEIENPKPRLDEILEANQTRKDIAELLIKEEDKTKKARKEAREARKELKELEESLEEAARINQNNEEYLKSLNEKLTKAESRLQQEGNTMQEIITSIADGLSLIETSIKQIRKSIQLDLTHRDEA